MYILFVLRNTGMTERMGIMSLSSILKQHGHRVELLLTGRMSPENCIAEVCRRAPEVLAYSIMTGEHRYHMALNELLRKHHHAFSVFGGPHATFAPEMIEAPGVDAVCRGEGDEVFVRLLARMAAGKDFYGTANFWFKKPDRTIVRNAIGPLPEDLDSFPAPDRALLYDADPALRAKGTKAFITMRGCPYKCTYCFNHAYNSLVSGKGKSIRMRSVDNVIREMKAVKRDYCLDYTYIDDDTFLIKPKAWLEEFAQRYREEVGPPLVCNIRANLLRGSSTAKLLRSMNCVMVYMGVECGNETLAGELLARNITNQELSDACSALRAEGIKVITQNLVGLPVDDPLAVDLETLDFNLKLRPHFGWSSLYYPYPGTKLGDLAAARGMFAPDYAKIHASNKTYSALNFGDPGLKRRIVNLHKLFGLVVQFPLLRRCLPWLISLPLTRLYTWLFFAFYGLKVPKNRGLGGFLRMLRHYLPFYFRYVADLERTFEVETHSRSAPGAGSDGIEARCEAEGDR